MMNKLYKNKRSQEKKTDNPMNSYKLSTWFILKLNHGFTEHFDPPP